MERLARLSHRIVWMNPHKGDDADFRPSTLGMMVAAPHVDLLLSGHDLASLEELARRCPGLTDDSSSVSLVADGDREMTIEEIVELADAVAACNGIASGIGTTSYGAQLVVEARTSDEAVERGDWPSSSRPPSAPVCPTGRSRASRPSARTTDLDFEVDE